MFNIMRKLITVATVVFILETCRNQGTPLAYSDTLVVLFVQGIFEIQDYWNRKIQCTKREAFIET